MNNSLQCPIVKQIYIIDTFLSQQLVLMQSNTNTVTNLKPILAPIQYQSFLDLMHWQCSRFMQCQTQMHAGPLVLA